MLYTEFTASDIQKILQQLFPLRRLVLSQFTFFNHIGVVYPTGDSFKRNRRCYRLIDVLPMACILALKEQGISLKNISIVPELIRNNAKDIFNHGSAVRLSGLGDVVHLDINSIGKNEAIERLLNSTENLTFWSYDVGALAAQILETTQRLFGVEEKQQAYA